VNKLADPGPSAEPAAPPAAYVPSIRTEERTLDTTPRTTSELPATPQRDRRIESPSWMTAPEALHRLGADIDQPAVIYLRRLGERWSLWRAGPAVDANSRYAAVDLSDETTMYTFTLTADGTGSGVGPDGVTYDRFRTWKESLRDTH
jgi:hypothetical protein